MRDHAIVSPMFWTGQTGQLLRKDADAQRLAMYLLTCPSSSMIGLYYLPIPVMFHELAMKESQLRKALRRVIQVGFCDYDEASEVIFVFEMARFQCGKTLNDKDKRKPAILRLLKSFQKCRLFRDFVQKYSEPYGLKIDLPASPSEGASDFRLQDQDQDQEKEQDKESPQPPATKNQTHDFDDKPWSASVVPLPHDDEKFVGAWREWVSMRLAKKAPVTNRIARLSIEKLRKAGLTLAEATDCVFESAANGWQGLVIDRVIAKRSNSKPPPTTRQAADDAYFAKQVDSAFPSQTIPRAS